MVTSCSAYGCHNKWSRETSVHFHKFPFRSEKLCNKWISALKRKNFIPTRASLVCSDHFRVEDYIKRPGMTNKRLKRDAVPSIFNFPVDDFLPPQYRKQLAGFTKCGRRPAKRGRKRKQRVVESVVSDIRNQNINAFDEALIEEMEVYDGEKYDCIAAEDFIDHRNEEDGLADADEEDKCYLLGSMWSERLKLLPVEVRIVVRRMIDRIFEEAQMGTLTEKFKFSPDP